MHSHIKTSFLFYTFIFFICLNSFFLRNTAAQNNTQSVDGSVSFSYTFERIEVPGVDFLALTASSDFEDYAGYTKSADGEKMVAFTLIDGIFTTYSFPDAENTYFYALANDGRAAGYYEDSDGLYHGVILKDGELQQYDFPGSVETEIYGISDETGALTGNFTDAQGVRRGFTGDTIIEVPGASETFADFVSEGRLVGSYIDMDGLYHTYVYTPDGEYRSVDIPNAEHIEFVLVHGINKAGVYVTRSKFVGDVTRTHVSTFRGRVELQFPDSVSTEGWNINQDGSVVGYYDLADGRRYGFIARPTTQAESDHFGNIFNVTLTKGLNMLSVPLSPPNPMTAKSLSGITGANVVIALDAANQRFIAWTPSAPDAGFAIEGGQGYIVNVPQTRNFAFVGAPWTDQTETVVAAPSLISTDTSQEAWAFVVSGNLEDMQSVSGYTVNVRNLRTNTVMTFQVRRNYFAAATADLGYRSVVEVGDRIEITVTDTSGNIVSERYSFTVNAAHLENAVMTVKLDSIGSPRRSQLLQNYPNPFNPETWIPYQLSEAGVVSISIYDAAGKAIRTFSLGHQSEGFYQNRGNAVYWDGRNAFGKAVASGIYFYQLTTPTFQQIRRLVILK